MKSSWKSEQQSTLVRECRAYFKSNPVFARLLEGFRRKYLSYGTFAGTVTLRNLNAEEMDALEGFLQRNYHGKKSVTISASRFHQALQDSRFGELSPKDVLELYFQEAMLGKKEQQERREKSWQEVYNTIIKRYTGTVAETWLCEIMQRKQGIYTYIRRQQKEADDRGETGTEQLQEAEQLLDLGARVINSLPLWQQVY